MWEKKHLTFNVDTNIIKKLKFLAVEYDNNSTGLFLEAIHNLLKKYEKKTRK